jgi:hypothetical protein
MAATVVGQWERFEVAIESPKTYADPYRDVGLDVCYTAPDGRKIAFWGFYDGDRTWRARFVPDQVGTWAYSASFSDGQSRTQGTFECIPSNVPGMISSHNDNPIWFGYKGGGHVLIRSLHVGDRFFAENYGQDARNAFLDWAQGQGYNLLSVASHYLNRTQQGRGAGWLTPALWPLDAAEYRKVECVLDGLSDRRMVVFAFAGFFGRGSNFPIDRSDQELYIRYVLARLGPYWNVMLNVSGPEPLLRKRVVLPREEINRLGRLIQSLDVFEHLLSVHNRTGDDEFRDELWPNYGILQGPKTVDLDELGAGLRASHHPTRPLYAQETLWSGNQHGHPDYTDDQLRKNAFVILMSGAALNFADNGGPTISDIGNSSSGFSGTLALADRRQWRHDILGAVWDWFETIPFYRMCPRQDLVSAGFCLAEVGERYVVYLPEGGAVDIAVEKGLYKVTWFCARETADCRAGGQTENGRGLVAPQEGEDWVLRLDRIVGPGSVTGS